MHASTHRGRSLGKVRATLGYSDLAVAERITGPRQVFARDFLPATDEEIEATLTKLTAQRAHTIDLIARADTVNALDIEDESVVQPTWMPWRTPRTIAEHLVGDASGTYLKRLGLPVITPEGTLVEQLDAAAAHLGRVIRALRRDLATEYKGEVWTSVKFLRRQCWHEGVEQVFLRRRLRASGVI